MPRPATISSEAIRVAAAEIGLAELSISAVAERLGVTRPAIYRHVTSRSELEELVGEHVLGDARPPERGDEPLEQHLESFAVWLRQLCHDTPGLADYMSAGFPRSERSAALMERVVADVVADGWSPVAGVFISTAVASHTLAQVRAEQTGTLAAAEGRLPTIEAALSTQPLVARAWPRFQGVDADTRFRWHVRCTVIGALVVAERELAHRS